MPALPRFPMPRWQGVTLPREAGERVDGDGPPICGDVKMIKSRSGGFYMGFEGYGSG